MINYVLLKILKLLIIMQERIKIRNYDWRIYTKSKKEKVKPQT